MEISKRVEKFISDCTRNCSNELDSFQTKTGAWVDTYHEWLTPDDALSAVAIAREEIYEWLLNHNDYITTNGNITSYNMEKLVEDLKQTMKNG